MARRGGQLGDAADVAGHDLGGREVLLAAHVEQAVHPLFVDVAELTRRSSLCTVPDRTLNSDTWPTNWSATVLNT